MGQEQVDYVISHVERDLAINKELSGRDYSPYLGIMLMAYIAMAPSLEASIISGTIALGKLEQEVKQETGRRPILHETKKCGGPIHELFVEGDEEGLEKIRVYAQGLMNKLGSDLG